MTKKWIILSAAMLLLVTALSGGGTAPAASSGGGTSGAGTAESSAPATQAPTGEAGAVTNGVYISKDSTYQLTLPANWKLSSEAGSAGVILFVPDTDSAAVSNISVTSAHGDYEGRI